jgi:hypothetical protein
MTNARVRSSRTKAEEGGLLHENDRDLAGPLRLRDHAPAGMGIATGEYGCDSMYAGRMPEAGAVDLLQADATRAGITGFLEAAALSDRGVASDACSGQSLCVQREQSAPCLLGLWLVVNLRIRRAPAVRGASVHLDFGGQLRFGERFFQNGLFLGRPHVVVSRNCN